ncbi:hypothetical protein KVC56_04730 [Helicobacter pylori]|nr:hypothetical protein KVC56_04730 [Helicobacter pylori]
MLNSSNETGGSDFDDLAKNLKDDIEKFEKSVSEVNSLNDLAQEVKKEILKEPVDNKTHTTIEADDEDLEKIKNNTNDKEIIKDLPKMIVDKLV